MSLKLYLFSMFRISGNETRKYWQYGKSAIRLKNHEKAVIVEKDTYSAVLQPLRLLYINYTLFV